MGTAIGVVFGYWFLASGLYYGVSFICNTQISFLQVLSLTVRMIKIFITFWVFIKDVKSFKIIFEATSFHYQKTV